MTILHEGKYTDEDNVEISRQGDAVSVTLQYPNLGHGRVTHVEVDQESVRASDGIRMHYDYDRDGWVIEQASRFSWAMTEPIDPDWQEVAFIQSWARQETEEQADARSAAYDPAFKKEPRP